MVRPTGLGARSHGGALPAAEGLALHDRARDRAVDGEVPRLDAVEPLREVGGILRVQPRRESVVDRVLQLDRLREADGGHDAEHGSEELLRVEARPRSHPRADARRPQTRPELARLDEPPLALVERRQRPGEFPARLGDERRHLGAGIDRRSDAQRPRRVDELSGEPRRARDGPDEDRERGGGTLLPRVREGAADEVARGEVDVGGGGHDDRVLAARLREQGQVGPPRPEEGRGVPRAREQDAIDGGMHDERAAHLVLVEVDEDEDVARHTGIPQRFGEDGRGAAGLGSGLEDDTRTGRKRRKHAARGDRQGNSTAARRP